MKKYLLLASVSLAVSALAADYEKTYPEYLKSCEKVFGSGKDADRRGHEKKARSLAAEFTGAAGQAFLKLKQGSANDAQKKCIAEALEE